MLIADRLRELREQKHWSQGEIEKRTGLLRCYISRVENGHTVPCLDTLAKLAKALEVPMYQLFLHNGEKPAGPPRLPKRSAGDNLEWGSAGKDGRVLGQFRRLLPRLKESNRKLLIHMAQKMAQPTRHRASP
jgi:transcriptional regulator with XRE-family HTH domain